MNGDRGSAQARKRRAGRALGILRLAAVVAVAFSTQARAADAQPSEREAAERSRLPVAAAKKGETLKLRLTSWSLVNKGYTKLQSGVLPDVQLEIGKTFYCGEVPGQGGLTPAELALAGQEDSPEKRAAADNKADTPK